MKIVCLAWGSLVWKPGVLPVDGAWMPGGPRLPIEFARVGDKSELATVLCPAQPLISVRWARLRVADLDTARELLRQREEIPIERPDGVGSVVAKVPGPLLGGPEILAWATATPDVDAVIWTALPPRFAGIEERVPTAAEAVSYLLSLTGNARRHAEAYIRQVPDEIRTANRTALERALST